MALQRSTAAGAAAFLVLCALSGCVSAPQDDPGSSQTQAPPSGAPPQGGDSPSPPAPDPGPVEGDPDTPIPAPDAPPETPGDLVSAIQRAVLTRETVRYQATASLGGIRRAEASGGYVFHAKDSIDFTADLDMRSRSGDDYAAQAVAVGDRFFLKPPTTDGLPSGAEWVGRSRADFEDPPEPRALYSEAIRAISGIRDWSMIAASSELLPSGRRTVNGVTGRGHRATFSVVDGMNNVSGTGGAWRVLQDLSAQGVRQITFTLWVDDDYLPVAVIVQMKSEDGPAHVDLTFTDWGDTLEFPVPDPGEVWNRS
ncbi:hypothetical protein [Nocardiopsis ansamitocini]|uniref:LppX_LprAFG lipoprotein n=1 Tax=Nocardiopsis ansamitocini TaxID=1670832 RepID=A0A9W6P5P7_9ACTN|nr:hypothetical protein [Nocardiopsis ansamitocini]GLU47621.1 hypothetical protein Nans01_19720 [Nocardiopsis ansamitocini]